MRWALIPFILEALCNAVGLIHPKVNVIANYTRTSAEFASGVMSGRSLSIVSRALLA
jgi:hypothetical protein